MNENTGCTLMVIALAIVACAFSYCQVEALKSNNELEKYRIEHNK